MKERGDNRRACCLEPRAKAFDQVRLAVAGVARHDYLAAVIREFGDAVAEAEVYVNPLEFVRAQAVCIRIRRAVEAFNETGVSKLSRVVPMR